MLVIEADEEKKRLVLSGRELAREKQDAEKKSQIARCETGAIMEGTVETIKPYGAFVLLENGLSGLVHVSQMSKKRVENPGAVVKVGQKVTVKILSTANGKLSLSMKEVEPDEAPEEEVFNYHESGEAYISSQLSDAIVFSVLIIVLLVRPTGILGKKMTEKV